MQIGNCGSPIELDEGWLLLTHGVGGPKIFHWRRITRQERSFEGDRPFARAIASPRSLGAQIIRVNQIKILVILPRDHRVFAIDLARKQRHTLVASRVAIQCRQAKRNEVGRLDEFRSDRPSAIGGIGRIICSVVAVAKLDEARVLDSIGLRFRDRENHPLADVLVEPGRQPRDRGRPEAETQFCGA